MSWIIKSVREKNRAIKKGWKWQTTCEKEIERELSGKEEEIWDKKKREWMKRNARNKCMNENNIKKETGRKHKRNEYNLKKEKKKIRKQKRETKNECKT